MELLLGNINYNAHCYKILPSGLIRQLLLHYPRNKDNLHYAIALSMTCSWEGKKKSPCKINRA